MKPVLLSVRRLVASRRASAWLVGWWCRWHPELSLGEQGEWAATKYLRRLGYHIIARRHRTPIGELDLIVVDGRTVVFVEVKTRQSDVAGEPHEAIDQVKQARLSRLALAYLKRHDLLDCRCRFDVVAVTWHHGRAKPTIEHFQNAFESTL